MFLPITFVFYFIHTSVYVFSATDNSNTFGVTPGDVLGISIYLHKKPNGSWIPVYTNLKGTNDSSIKLEIEHKITYCGPELLHGITAFLKKAALNKTYTDLRSLEESKTSGCDKSYKNIKFDQRSDANVRVIEEGKVAIKTGKGHEYNIVTTCRPLMDDELFEVRMDRGYIQMGATILTPSQMEHVSEVRLEKSGTWIWNYLSDAVYHNGIKPKDGVLPLIIRVCNRYGVMKKKNGWLHFFCNGSDMGPAAFINESVYGFVELQFFATRVTIIK